MIAAHTFRGKTVAIFGLGISGLSAARALVSGGAFPVAWDDNEAGRVAAARLGVPVADLRTQDWRKFETLILAPGVPLTHPKPHWVVNLARVQGIEIIGDTEIFFRERKRSGADVKVLAVTGTNGKSTTTALMHHLLTANGFDAVMGGNIGTAVLDLPDFEDGRVYVLELSSFQLDLSPGIETDGAALLNITPDHLDRHGTMENYAAVKAKIFAVMRNGGAAAIGVDDIYSLKIAHDCARRGIEARHLSVSAKVDQGVYYDSADAALVEVTAGAETARASLDGIGSLRGTHNAQNAAAAMAALPSLGLQWDRLASALKTFPGLPHRMEEVGRIGPVLFVNDSKATNAESAAHALASFSNIYWIAGGKPKDGGIATLAPYFPKIATAYLIGEAADAFAATLRGHVPVSECGTLDAAVRVAYADARRSWNGQAVVLLSPACASYDQFQNFEVRGDAFRVAVQALGLDTGKNCEA